MKRLALILTLVISNTLFSQTDSVNVSVLDNSLCITWLGHFDEIEIIDQNGSISPRIPCPNDTRLNISPSDEKSVLIRFFCDGKLVLERGVKLL